MIQPYAFDNANEDGDKEAVILPNPPSLINKLSANETNGIKDKLNEVIANITGEIFQDNIDKVITIELQDDQPISAVVSTVNALAYNVSEIESVWVKVIYQDVTGPLTRVELYKVINKGKGMLQLATGNPYEDLLFIYNEKPTVSDIDDLETTDIFTISSLGGLSISQYINEHVPNYTIQNQSEGYTIFKVASGASYLFIGEGGIYGSTGRQSTDADFQLLSEAPAGPASLNFIKSNEDLSGAKRNGAFLYGILDQYTGEEITLSKATGTPTVDNVIYFQLGSEYFKRNSTFIKPEWFGLDGENDQIAINKALSINNDNTDKGILVQLEPGKTYYTSSPVYMTGRQHLLFNGALIKSTSTTKIITGIDNLLSSSYTHRGAVIDSPILESDTALIGIDLMGFTSSVVKNPRVRLNSVNESAIGIWLRHGTNSYDQCYFNNVSDCNIFIGGRGRGIVISGTGSSGANANHISRGIISGLDRIGVHITDENNVGNTVIGVDLEAFEKDNSYERFGILCESPLNTIMATHIETYNTPVKLTSNGNTVIGLNYANQQNNPKDEGDNTWISGQSGSTSIGSGSNDELDPSTRLRISASGNNTAMRYDSKSANSLSRNWAVVNNSSGESQFGWRRSNSINSDPMTDGKNVFFYKGETLNVIGEGGGKSIVDFKADTGSFAKIQVVSKSYSNGMSVRHYEDGSAALFLEQAKPIVVYIGGEQIMVINPDKSVIFYGNPIIPNATAQNHGVALNQLQDNVISITSNKTVTLSDFTRNNNLIIYANSDAGVITVNLPSASVMKGYNVSVFNTSLLEAVLISGGISDTVAIDKPATFKSDGIDIRKW